MATCIHIFNLLEADLIAVCYCDEFLSSNLTIYTYLSTKEKGNDYVVLLNSMFYLKFGTYFGSEFFKQFVTSIFVYIILFLNLNSAGNKSFCVCLCGANNFKK